MKNSRLHRIRLENARYEKQTPYNHCDRWCERCPGERQARCTLYKDELERKVTAIAHGRDEDDSQVTEEVMRWQYEAVDEKLQKFMEEEGIDLEDIDDQTALEFEKRIESAAENDSLNKTIRQYHQRTYKFLQKTFFHSKNIAPEIKYDFETTAWYFTLLPAKLHRALSGFYKAAAERKAKDEENFALQDAVAQFDICLDGIEKSLQALRRLKVHYPQDEKLITELLALLQNLSSRIVAMEESV